MRNSLNNPGNSFERRSEDKQNVINYIVKTIETGTGKSLFELKRNHTQCDLYRIGLKYVTTTNKALCMALDIPVEAGTRRKRKLEKEGFLVASFKQKICPYTLEFAKYLTTDPNKFNEIIK